MKQSHPISLAFSTCPNDTFMFDAWVHGRIPTEGIELSVTMGDIFHLNQMATREEPDVVKISYNTFGKVADNYHLLDAGSALGHNCGPLLISKDPLTLEEIASQNLPVAIPGKNTTANLLLDFFASSLENTRAWHWDRLHNRPEKIFHEVMPAILSGEVAAGVIIHENRFTYQSLGLQCIQDLGEYWESQTQLPIPLGAIVAHKRLGPEKIATIEKLMHDSVAYAFGHPEASLPYVRAHAQEMDPEVMKAHIELYVNEYSLSLGEKGRAAIKKLLETQ